MAKSRRSGVEAVRRQILAMPDPEARKWALLALSHWKQHRPKMFKALLEAGTLAHHLMAAGQRTADAIRDLVKKGLYDWEAEELMREEWVLLPDERDVPVLGEPPTGRPGSRCVGSCTAAAARTLHQSIQGLGADERPRRLGAIRRRRVRDDRPRPGRVAASSSRLRHRLPRGRPGVTGVARAFVAVELCGVPNPSPRAGAAEPARAIGGAGYGHTEAKEPLPSLAEGYRGCGRRAAPAGGHREGGAVLPGLDE